MRQHRSSSILASATTMTETEPAHTLPAYTFGLLTDIQHAPIPDGHSYTGNARYYRHAITAAAHAAQHFQDLQVHCVVNLGDIIDGKCVDVLRWGGGADDADVSDCVNSIIVEEKKISGDECDDGSEESSNTTPNDRDKQVMSVGLNAIDNVLQSLSVYNCGRILHTYGNHELYNLSREQLATKLEIPFTREPSGDLVGYYTYLFENRDSNYFNYNKNDKEQSSSMKLRAIVLDTYDVCLLDRCPESSQKRHRAHEILMANNHNYPQNENSPEGLEGLSRRFVAFNGGIDKPQLEWLQYSLQCARSKNEKVVIFSHQPIHPESSFPTCLVWNYDEVLDILRSYNDVVLASFSGHAHQGGYVRDETSGIHFRSVEAVLESSPPVRTYAIVDVFDDRLVIRGEGDCLSDVYDLDHTLSKKNRNECASISRYVVNN